MRHLYNRYDDFLERHLESSGAPYSSLASVYDHVMSHVDYIGWTDYIVELFEFVNIPVTRMLETACGTASLALELSMRGKIITACDRSPEMAHVGARKIDLNGSVIPLFVADMRSLPLNGPFDAVICLYDSLNYMLNKKDILNALKEAYRVLKNGGVYVFDVCTIRNSELYFDDMESKDRFGDTRITRRCVYDPAKHLQANHFIIENPYTGTHRESHYQHIYYLKEIQELIERTGFTEIGRFDDMSFAPGTELSDRVHFVLQKKI